MRLTQTPEADGVQRPSHRHHAARLEAAILGGAFDAARHFLTEQGRVFQDNDEPLAKRSESISSTTVRGRIMSIRPARIYAIKR